jgi:glycine C-acetyltransferase
MIDESHGTGHLGPTGRGAAEELGVLARIDIITSTLGKTLGGAVGGFTTAGREVVDFLRQRSRPYLFSNSLTPSIAAAAKKAIEIAATSTDLRTRLRENTRRLRSALEGAGFVIKPGQSPILPVMIGDAALAAQMADKLLDRGVYVIGFSYPVVPHGQARIRIQVSAAHAPEQLDHAATAFTEVGRELGIIK